MAAALNMSLSDAAERAVSDRTHQGGIGDIAWPKSLGPAHDLTLMLGGKWRGTHGVDDCGWGYCDRGDGSVLAIEGKAFPGRWKEIKLRARDLRVIVHRKREGESEDAPMSTGGLTLINPAEWEGESTPPREWVLTDWTGSASHLSHRCGQRRQVAALAAAMHLHCAGRAVSRHSLWQLNPPKLP